jgi:probable F420-dependent oxidoreductase
MLVDTSIGDDGANFTLEQIGTLVHDAEAAGFDGAWAAEIKHDPFLACLIGALHSERIAIGTAIAVAFARSPMTVATTANDLQTLSKGRFTLGLGSQIKPHIERRFSMPWSSPAARMREYVRALHAIWTSWETGDRLDFRGDFYKHTLMSPMFSPGANPYGRPKVVVAAVGEQMTRVAAEASDGLLVHSFNTARYLREVTAPVVGEGLRQRGLARTDFEISYPAFVATGTTAEAFAAASRAVRKQIAFYGSTPAYRPVLELHGWDELHLELNRMSKRGEWDQMTDLIDDDVFTTFAVAGSPDEVGPQLVERFSGTVDRISLYTPNLLDLDVRDRIITSLRSGRPAVPTSPPPETS